MLKKSTFVSDSAVLIYLATIKLFLHLYVNFTGGYGIFRDEFYYLACADHLAFGNVDQPPLSIAILAVWRFFFGDSLFSIRFLPALLGAVMVYLTGIIVKELGGKRFAQILAALCVIVAPGYLALHGFYSMNVFDHVFWTVLILILIKIIKGHNSALWLLFGALAGLGLQNKFSVLFLLFGLAIGILFTKNRRWLADKYLWIGAGIALLLFAPHIIWQIQNGWPTLEFMANAAHFKNVRLAPQEFFKEQILNMNPGTALIWLAGVFALFSSPALKKYRLFAIAYAAIFTVFIVQAGKAYYLYPIYPVFFAAGALIFERLFAFRYTTWLKPVFIVLLIVSGLFSAPFALPILPVERYIDYAEKTGISPSVGEHHEMGVLPQHFADMHGWEDMVAEIAHVYHNLPDSVQVSTAIYVQNYGEAGAIDYYRDKYNLPPALCGHNNYFLWGTRGLSPKVLIIFGGKIQDHQKVFESVVKAGEFNHPYVMPYENNQPVFICRGLKITIERVWPTTRHFG